MRNGSEERMSPPGGTGTKICLIFISGEHPGRERIEEFLPETGLVIAADGGYDIARKLGVRVDVLLGDMDSISEFPPPVPGLTVERHPRDKDFTDTEIALAYAFGRGFERVFLIGGGGGRLDHLLAIWELFKRDPAPERWYTACDEVLLVKKRFSAEMRSSGVLSFFPVSEQETRARTRGLRWNLDALTWRQSDFGVSNEMTGTALELEVVSGRLALVRGMESKEPGLAPGYGPF